MNLLERSAAAVLIVIGLGLFGIYAVNDDSIVEDQLEEANDSIPPRWNSRTKRIVQKIDDNQKLQEANDVSDGKSHSSIPAMLEPEKSNIAPKATLNSTESQIHVTIGESVYVACYGNYKNVSWSRGNQVIARESNNTTSVFYHAYTIMGVNTSILIIKDVIKQSAGHYECSVVDSSNQKTSTAGFQLIIKEPEVHIHLTDTFISKYSTEHYNNTCKGNSKNIQWINPKGQTIGAERDRSYPYVKYGEKEAEIIFESLDVNMQGIYTCVITLNGAINSSQFDLIVEARRNLFFSPDEDSAEVEVKESYSIDCYGALDSLFWKDFNNNNVTFEKSERIYAENVENKVKLVIKRASYKLAGNYTCVGIIEIENKMFERVFSLKVIKNKSLPPLILIPSNSTIQKEAGTYMSVICKGETSKLQWKGPPNNWIIPEKDSNIYNTGVKAIDDDEYESKLVMENLKANQSGIYTCEMGNDDNTRTQKKHFTLTVYVRIYFLHNETAYETVEGEAAITLKCGVEGSPAPNVIWYFNGQSIGEIDKSHYQWIGDDIMILSPKYTDTGKYICSAHQQITATDGFDDSRAMSLKVKHKPVFPNGQKITLYNYVNRTIELYCNDTSYPRARYNWIKGDKLIGINKHVNYISVNFASASDFGDYECEARNEYGSATLTVTVMEGENPDVPLLEVKKTCSRQVELAISSERTTITHYIVQYRVENEQMVSSKSFIKGGSNYILDSLNPATTYVIKAASVNNVEQSDFSQERKFTTENCAFHQQLSLLMKVTLTMIMFQLFY